MHLHTKVKAQDQIIQAQDQALAALRRYVNSAKFSQDIMVNKNDILLRLDESQRDISRLASDLGL